MLRVLFITTLFFSILMSLLVRCEDLLILRHKFEPFEIMEVEIIDTVTDFGKPEKGVDKKEFKLTFECRTESIESKNSYEEAAKTITFKNLSIKHFMKDKEIPIDSKNQKAYDFDREKLLKRSWHFSETSFGHIIMTEKDRPYEFKMFVPVFGRFVSTPLPADPVKVGEKWSNPYYEAIGENTSYRSLVVIKYEYGGMQKMDGVSCAKIIAGIHGEPCKINNKHPDMHNPIERITPQSPTLTETIYFDPKNGKLIRQEITHQKSFYSREGMPLAGPVTIKEIVTYSYKDPKEILIREFLEGKKNEWQKALAELEKSKETNIITRGLSHISFEVRFAVSEALYRINDKSALPTAISVLKTENENTGTATDKFLPRMMLKIKLVKLIEKLTGEKFTISNYDNTREVGEAIKKMEFMLEKNSKTKH
jgi:hypothetical protein